MLKRVREQRPSYNNNQRIATNITVSSLKLWYYQLFAQAFSFVGSFPRLVMVNSSWTLHHIESLWHLSRVDNNPPMEAFRKRRLVLIYPPCNTLALQSIPLSRPRRFVSHLSPHNSDTSPVSSRLDLKSLDNKVLVISIGQFRPEKDHWLQIE